MTRTNPTAENPLNRAAIITLISFPLLLTLIGVILFSVLINSQHQLTENHVNYFVTGGYANTTDLVDPHLQRRLDEQKGLLAKINAQFKIDGYWNQTELDNLAINSYLATGKPKPTDRTTVQGNQDYYLDPSTNIAELNKAATDYLKSEGFIITQDSADANGEYALEATRDSLPKGSTAKNPKESLELDFGGPVVGQNYVNLTVYDDSKAEYTLSTIPYWDGLIPLSTYSAEYKWTEGDPINHIKEICDLPVNHFYGYWDKSFNCLASVRWSGEA
jgi:hypothetical protein